MKDKDRDRIMQLLDAATDEGSRFDELDTDEIMYDDDPVKQWERRIRECEVAALGAIAFLLARQDEEVWDAWQRW